MDWKEQPRRLVVPVITYLYCFLFFMTRILPLFFFFSDRIATWNKNDISQHLLQLGKVIGLRIRLWNASEVSWKESQKPYLTLSPWAPRAPPSPSVLSSVFLPGRWMVPSWTRGLRAPKGEQREGKVQKGPFVQDAWLTLSGSARRTACESVNKARSLGLWYHGASLQVRTLYSNSYVKQKRAPNFSFV